MKLSAKTAISKIKNLQNGQFFKVVFIKRTDGTERQMICRKGVQKYLKGGQRAYDPDEKNLIFVWDSEKFQQLCVTAGPKLTEELKLELGGKCFRSINLESLVALTIGGETYEIEGKEMSYWICWWKEGDTNCSMQVKARTEDEAKTTLRRKKNFPRLPRGATFVKV